MLEYKVTAKRIDVHGSLAHCKEAQIILDTDMRGRPDAFNPAELFLAALAACMIKGIERALIARATVRVIAGIVARVTAGAGGVRA